MEDIPEFKPFLPEGLQTCVSRDVRTVSRQDLFGNDGCADQDAITFVIHTVDIRDGLLIPVPLSDVCDEKRIEMCTAKEHERYNDRVQLMQDERASTGDNDVSIEPTGCHAYIIGQTESGWKVGFVVPFQPFCEVELEMTMQDKQKLLSAIPSLAYSLRIKPSDMHVHWHTGCRFKGYIPDSSNPLKRKTFLYARLFFPTLKHMETGARRLQDGVFCRGTRVSFSVYEDRIDADQKFVDLYNLIPSGWHAVSKSSLRIVDDSERHLLVNTEYFLNDASEIRQVETPSHVPPMIVVSIDGEMNGTKPDRFPKAHRDTDSVVVVGLVFAIAGGTSGSEGVEFERQAFILSDTCDPIDGVIVRLFDNELDLIAAVRDELFVRKMVDIVSGHNIVKFDMQYLGTRIQRVSKDNDCQRFLRFSALIGDKLELREKKLSSPAMGSNTLVLLFGVGFAYVDTMLLCKQNHKLRENTLTFASTTFLPDDTNKFDLPYNLIPYIASGKDGRLWRMLTAYCVQDCVLVLKLLKKWDSIKDLVAQSRVINIPMAVNLLCGQQQRVRDSLMKKARTMGMVMNGVNERKKVIGENVSAEGGWVLENVQGLHDKPVVVLDFASLYPSVQREHNLCWSTVVEDIDSITEEHRSAGLEVKTYDTATGTYHIVSNVPGVFPLQLKDLLDMRKQYKKDMATAEYGSSDYQNADAKQKATKIVMNSGYGTANCEEGKGIMPCKAVGTITCAEGRKLNQRAELVCKERFGTDILYGDTDSIMVHFPETQLYERILAEHGREPTRKERLEYAMEMGMRAEHVLNEEVFCSDVIKTECEKVYFPFLSSGKKTYAGLKFEEKDIAKAGDDLERPDKKAGRSGGSIEAKGIRTVRRDVPLFCREMTQKMLDALFFDRNIDLFWHIVHDFAERVCHLDFDIKAFELTKELKEGYWLQATVAPHVAVSYAREYAHPGSGFVEGDRVGFVIVEEADPQRVIKPEWLNTGFVPDFVDTSKHVKETLDPKRSMCARHVDEVVKYPDTNHIDVVYYVEMGICSVLSQLVPNDVDAQKELLRYAAQARSVYRSFREKPSSFSMLVVSEEKKEVSREDILKMLPKLSHKRPIKTQVVSQSLNGVFGVSVPEKRQAASKAKKKTAVVKKSGDVSSFF